MSGSAGLQTAGFQRGKAGKTMCSLFRAACMAAALAAALAVSAPVPVFAQEEAPEAVRVGYYERGTFEEGASEGAAKSGYAYAYYQKLSEYTGWRYEYVYGEYGELYQKLLDGGIDLLAGVAYEDGREGLPGYPALPMGSRSYILMKHSSEDAVTTDPSTLAGQRIGVLEGAAEAALLAYLRGCRAEAEVEVEVFQEYDSLFYAYDHDGVDLLAVEEGVVEREHSKTVASFGSVDYYLCVDPARQDLLEELDRAQAQLFSEEPGFLAALGAEYSRRSVPGRALTAPEEEWRAQHGSLTIGCLEHFLPYSDTDRSGGATGLVSDVVPRILDSLGIGEVEVSYRAFGNYDEMLSEAAAGKIDAAFPVGGDLYYAEESGIHLSAPVLSAQLELVCRTENAGKETDSFAVNENHGMQEYCIKRWFPDAERMSFVSTEDCLQAVLEGKADCTVLDGLRAEDILKNRRYDGLSHMPLSRMGDQCFGVRIGEEGLLRLLNRGISAVGEEYASGRAYRYKEGLYEYSMTDIVRDNQMLVAAVLAGINALIIFFLVRDRLRAKRQVREKEAAWHRLEESFAETEKAGRARELFLHGILQQIRAPMNAIAGHTARADACIHNREQVKDSLEKISSAGRHLSILIDEALELERIERGETEIEEIQIHLPDLLHEIRDFVRPGLTSRHLQLSVNTENVVSEDILADRQRLSQVLLNLLSCAIRHAPDKGTIGLCVIEKAGAADGHADLQFRIRGSDAGRGKEAWEMIPAEQAGNAEQTGTAEQVGTGEQAGAAEQAGTGEQAGAAEQAGPAERTGTSMSFARETDPVLAVTKSILAKMGGTLFVETGAGEGCEFVVDLSCRAAGTKGGMEQLSQLKGLRVLVADEDTNTCLGACAMLRGLGMRPDWTNSGLEAVIRAKEAVGQGDAFSVFLIDAGMPEPGGIETARRILRAVGESAPRVILTAYDWADGKEEALEAGVAAFSRKPFFLSELGAALAAVLR